MAQNYDVVVVGAGAAGVFMAYEFVKLGKNIKVCVIDQGGPVSKRKCPIDGKKIKSCIHCKFQTAFVTAFQQLAVPFGQPALHYRSDSVDNIVARQIIRRSNFSPACRLIMSLHFHYLSAFQPQAHPSKSVYAVVYTIVARVITPCHA